MGSIEMKTLRSSLLISITWFHVRLKASIVEVKRRPFDVENLPLKSNGYAGQTSTCPL